MEFYLRESFESLTFYSIDDEFAWSERLATDKLQAKIVFP